MNWKEFLIVLALCMLLAQLFPNVATGIFIVYLIYIVVNKIKDGKRDNQEN